MRKQPQFTAEETLLNLYDSGHEFLEEYPWEWEDDRWHEFLCCTLIAAIGQGQEVRRALQTLREMGMLTQDGLADAEARDLGLLSEVLRRHGFDGESGDPEELALLLVAVARVVRTKWKSRLQRFLREHGDRMAAELAGAMTAGGVSREVARKAAVLWLQNVANLPIVDTDDAHLRRFRSAFALSNQALLDVADRTGVNVSVLDDLLALEVAVASANGGAKPKRKAKK